MNFKTNKMREIARRRATEKREIAKGFAKTDFPGIEKELHKKYRPSISPDQLPW
jgi:hypothetical protein